LPILEKYDVKNVAVHALSKQLYKGGVHLDAFQACVDQSKVKLYYNLTTVTKFKNARTISCNRSLDDWTWFDC
jgi:hypothetical protein